MSREQFEAWMAAEQWFHGSDFEWDDRRNCYSQFGIHLAYKAWLGATEQAEAKCAALAAELKQSQIDAGCYKHGMEACNARLAQVAAENAGLNEKMNKLATWPGIEFYSSAWEFNGGDGDTALEFMCDVQTPATDAYFKERGDKC